jgi:RNA polymerase sigma-70 factor (ECF subfamily)
VVFGTLSNDDFLAIVDDAPDAEMIAIGRDEFRRLQDTISAMPEVMRRVFTLKKVYGRTSAEIADELGLSISSIEKYLTKGLRFCSERLARDTVGKPRRGVADRWLRTVRRDGNV